MNNENANVRPECPVDEELESYLSENAASARDAEIERHIIACDRCYLMLKVLKPLAFDEEYEPEGYEPPEKFPEWLDGYARELAGRQEKINANKRSLKQIQDAGGVKFAQMWKPKTEKILLVTPEGDEYHSFADFGSVPHFVVVANEDADNLLDRSIVRAFPVHDEDELNAEDDLLLTAQNSPTGYSFFIQSWNPCDILIENLGACIGEIAFREQTELAEKLKKLGRKRPAKKEAGITGAVILQEVFIEDFKADALVRYRRKELKETAYLRAPAEFLRETAELQKETIGEQIRGFLQKLLDGFVFSPSFSLKPQSEFKSEGEQEIIQTDLGQIVQEEDGDGGITIQVFLEDFALIGRPLVLFVIEDADSSSPIDAQILEQFDENWIGAEFRISKERRSGLPHNSRFKIELKEK